MSVLRQDTAAIQDALAQAIRVGEVVSTDPASATVRVKIHDADGLVTYPLRVLQHKTLHDQQYWMPDVNEHVMCLFLPYGAEQGFVLGAFYSAADTPPVSSQDKDHTVYKDGTWHEYDRDEHKLHGEIKGEFDFIVDEDAALHVKKNVTLTVDEDVDVRIKGNCNVIIEQDATIRVEGDADTTVMGDAETVVVGQTDIHSMGPCNVRSDSTLEISAAYCITMRCDRHGMFRL